MDAPRQKCHPNGQCKICEPDGRPLRRSALGTFWTRLKAYRRRRTPVQLNGIHSADQFRAILVRQRAAADRHHHRFSLLTFDVGDPDISRDCIQHLVDVLVARIRLTDEAGWFNETRIGVLLPYTSAAVRSAWPMTSAA